MSLKYGTGADRWKVMLRSFGVTVIAPGGVLLPFAALRPSFPLSHSKNAAPPGSLRRMARSIDLFTTVAFSAVPSLKRMLGRRL